MAHPIFDAKKYPFGIKEAFELFEELYRYHFQMGTIDLVYRICYNDPLEPLLQGAQSMDVWRDALDKLAKYNRLTNLPKALRAKGTDPGLEAKLKNAEDYNPSTAQQQSCSDEKMKHIIISDKTLVLDRKDIRDSICTILSDTGNQTSVLLIRGSRQSGKSHGKHLFELHGKERNEIVVYLSGKTVFTLDDLLRRLFLPLDLDMPAGQDTTDPAWYSKVCIQLLRAKTSDNCYWIVIDDVARLDTRIKEFIDQFAAMMEDSIFRQHFRLILLHYPDEIPTSWNEAHFQDLILEANSITANDVAEAFKEWCLKKQVNMMEDRINEIAKQIIADADIPPVNENPPSSRLKRIHTGILENFKKLLNNPPV